MFLYSAIIFIRKISFLLYFGEKKTGNFPFNYMLNPEHCNLTIMASKRKYYKELQTINRNIFLHN